MALGVAMDKVNALPAMKNLPSGVRPVESGEAEFQGRIFGGFILAMVTAYAGRNLIFEQRTSVNNQRAAQAFEAATTEYAKKTDEYAYWKFESGFEAAIKAVEKFGAGAGASRRASRAARRYRALAML